MRGPRPSYFLAVFVEAGVTVTVCACFCPFVSVYFTVTCEPVSLDIVPLFESADALENSAQLLDALLTDARYRRHLERRGNRQDVMLGYSDSTKESGPLAAVWML